MMRWPPQAGPGVRTNELTVKSIRGPSAGRVSDGVPFFKFTNRTDGAFAS